MDFYLYFSILTISLSVASLRPGTSASPHDRCNKEISTCLKDIVHILNDTKLAFAQDEEQLDKLCKHLNQTVVCVNEFILYCMGSELQIQYNMMISGTLVLIDKLCVRSSDFRRRYLLHAKCYHELADDYKKCAQVYYENEKDRMQSSTIREKVDLDLELKLWCCNYDAHRECTREAVAQTCGKDAASLAEQIVVTGGGNIVATHCSNYTLTSGRCGDHVLSSSSASQRSFSPSSRENLSSMPWMPSLLMLMLCGLTRSIKFT